MIERELLDSAWLNLHGKQAAEQNLTTAEMAMCRSLGITPAQFKESQDQLNVTEALVNGRKPDIEVLRTRSVDLFKSPKSSNSEDLTADQQELCRQLGLSPKQFKQSKNNLATARLI